jgi:hypothetical protein
VACRNVGVKSYEELREALENSTCPQPVVEHIDAVADIKTLFNPYNSPTFQDGPVVYPKGTSIPLYFLFVQDIVGRTVIRDKANHTLHTWSDPFLIWSGKKVMSGLKLKNLKGCTGSTLTQASLDIVEAGLNSCYNRMNATQIRSCKYWFRTLSKPKVEKLHWTDNGYFRGEHADRTQPRSVPTVVEEFEPCLPLTNSRAVTGLHAYTWGGAMRGSVAAELREKLRKEQTGLRLG